MCLRTLLLDCAEETPPALPWGKLANIDRPIAAVVPLMLFVMPTVLMVRLESFQRLFMVIAVAPLVSSDLSGHELFA